MKKEKKEKKVLSFGNNVPTDDCLSRPDFKNLSFSQNHLGKLLKNLPRKIRIKFVFLHSWSLEFRAFFLGVITDTIHFALQIVTRFIFKQAMTQ